MSRTLIRDKLQSKKARTLILGIGNPILSDDSAGLRIARRLKETNPELNVVETSEAGLALLEYADGYERLIIIDSIKTGTGKVGELYVLTLDNIKAHKEVTSFHGVNIATAFELGKRLGYRLPVEVRIYAIEIKDNLTFSGVCTAEVEEKIPLVAGEIMDNEELY